MLKRFLPTIAACTLLVPPISVADLPWDDAVKPRQSENTPPRNEFRSLDRMVILVDQSKDFGEETQARYTYRYQDVLRFIENAYFSDDVYSILAQSSRSLEDWENQKAEIIQADFETALKDLPWRILLRRKAKQLSLGIPPETSERALKDIEAERRTIEDVDGQTKELADEELAARFRKLYFPFHSHWSDKKVIEEWRNLEEGRIRVRLGQTIENKALEMLTKDRIPDHYWPSPKLSAMSVSRKPHQDRWRSRSERDLRLKDWIDEIQIPFELPEERDPFYEPGTQWRPISIMGRFFEIHRQLKSFFEGRPRTLEDFLRFSSENPGVSRIVGGAGLFLYDAEQSVFLLPPISALLESPDFQPGSFYEKALEEIRNLIHELLVGELSATIFKSFIADLENAFKIYQQYPSEQLQVWMFNNDEEAKQAPFHTREFQKPYRTARIYELANQLKTIETERTLLTFAIARSAFPFQSEPDLKKIEQDQNMALLKGIIEQVQSILRRTHQILLNGSSVRAETFLSEDFEGRTTRSVLRKAYLQAAEEEPTPPLFQSKTTRQLLDLANEHFAWFLEDKSIQIHAGLTHVSLELDDLEIQEPSQNDLRLQSLGRFIREELAEKAEKEARQTILEEGVFVMISPRWGEKFGIEYLLDKFNP